MKVPLVSVVMPVRDPDPGHFAEAVESVLGQTYGGFELVIVDDNDYHSPLDTSGFRDKRIRTIRSSGRGIIDALNTGLEAAGGSFIARMDADDICMPRRFETQLQAIRARGLDIAGSSVEVFGECAQEGYRIYEEWINSLATPDQIEREIFIESPLPHPSVMMKSEAVRELGGYREMGWPEDYDLWLRAMEAGFVMGKAPEVLLRWRDTSGRASRVDGRYSKRNFIRAKAHFLARTVFAGKTAVIWGAGRTGGALAGFMEKEGASIRAFIDISPKRIGRRKRGRPVLPPEEAAAVKKDELILTAVPSRGARDIIREYLARLGKAEGRDYFMAA